MPRSQRIARPRGGAVPGCLSAVSDEELVERIRGAEEQAFNLLYERYFQRVYSFVYLRLRNRADTEEVVQEVFTAAFRSIDAFSGRSSLLAWIYGIAKNTVNNHIRRARAHEQRLERAEPELLRSSWSLDSCTPEEHLNLRRSEEAIRERLSAMADWHAEVFVLRHVENLSIGEIASRVSKSNDAVRSSLYRMKKMLVDAVGSNAVAAG
ncbi:MAG: RNA polymerase sigma factor [Myxococcota bacterium]|nr:RNA polymerase sigma factor [Myxococcota bacterium]